MQLNYDLHIFCNIIENLLQMTWQSLLQDMMSIMADIENGISPFKPFNFGCNFCNIFIFKKKKSPNIQPLKT